MTMTQTRRPGIVALASLVPFVILLVVGLVLVGSSAPFWQVLLVAVVAGLIGLGTGRIVARTARR